MLTSILMLPHGAEIIPAPGHPYNEMFRPLHRAMEEVGQQTARDNTDLLIMLTPHGTSLAEAFGVYQAERYQGIFYDLSESNVYGDVISHSLWSGDAEQAKRLLESLKQRGIAAEGIIQGSPDYPLALTWSEAVPLHYLAAADNPRALIMSLPRKRFSQLGAMQQDLIRLARVYLDLAEAYPGRASIVISADLAHTHSDSGPYGFHESAAVFDSLVQEWVRSPTEDRLASLLALQPTAKACGMAGLRVLQTILSETKLTSQQAVYAVPTYYGMLVARWS